MAVYSIWESRFPSGSAADGLRITTAIWDDMPGYDGYLGHEIVQDLDDPGHLLVVSRWTSRERADQVLREYAGHPNAAAANELVAEPRRRFVAHQVHVGGSPEGSDAAE